MKYFNPDRLDADLFEDEQLAEQLFDMFMFILEEEMQKMSSAFKNSNFAAFTFAIHKMKPNFGYLKLDQGCKLCHKLEQEVRDKKDKAQISQTFAEF